MTNRGEDRRDVDFQVFLSWEAKNGGVQRVAARCLNLSPSGAKLETKDPVEVRAGVLIHSGRFGRMGMASIRYCVRDGMKYEVGLEFSAPFALGDPVRKKILENLSTHR